MTPQLLFWVCFALVLLMIATRTPRETVPVFLFLLLAILALTGLIT